MNRRFLADSHLAFRHRIRLGVVGYLKRQGKPVPQSQLRDWMLTTRLLNKHEEGSEMSRLRAVEQIGFLKADGHICRSRTAQGAFVSLPLDARVKRMKAARRITTSNGQ